MLYTDLTGKQMIMKAAAKIQNAEEREIECTLEFEDFKKLFSEGDGRCQYSGEEFLDFSDITIERIDPRKGYVQGNVAVVKQIYNITKSAAEKYLKDERVPGHVKLNVLRRLVEILEEEVPDEVVFEEISRDASGRIVVTA